MLARVLRTELASLMRPLQVKLKLTIHSDSTSLVMAPIGIITIQASTRARVIAVLGIQVRSQ